MFLEVLPGDIRQWMTVAQKNRTRYAELKSHYVIDPHETEDMSLTVNNPLSQEEQVWWVVQGVYNIVSRWGLGLSFTIAFSM